MVNLRALRLLSILALATLPVAVVDGDWAAVAVLAGAAVVGWLPSVVVPGAEPPASTRAAMAEVAVSWTVLATAAATVTWLLAQSSPAGSALVDPVSALFEATSGISTTGLSMVPNPDELTPTIQWWRSILQWGGAAGVVTFGLFVAERSGDKDAHLDSEWGAQPAEELHRSIRIILGLLAGLTVVGFIALWVADGRPWAAANHAITAAATGGFSVDSGSAGDSPPLARAALAAVLLASSVSFATLWGVATRSGPPLWKRTQVRWSLALVAVLGGAAVVASLGQASIGDVMFNAVSASTTAGFSAGDSYQTIPAVTVVAITSMIIGGSAGSTAGGIKVARVAWIAKAARRWLPQGGEVYDQPFVWDGERVDTDEAADRVTGAGTLIAVWLVTIVAATFALAFSAEATVSDALFEATSALSGVGLSSGVTDRDLAAGPKLVLTGAMLAGRVEVTAFIALAVHAGRVARS